MNEIIFGKGAVKARARGLGLETWRGLLMDRPV